MANSEATRILHNHDHHTVADLDHKTDLDNERDQELSTIETIIEDARNGRMFILVDDEARENEGDLIIPAQMCTPDAINFMAKYGRGLICLAMRQVDTDRLGLHLMPQTNASRLATAFTISIEAREGVTTGISASDRARTISVATALDSSPEDITTPGHIFPVVAREGGVLVRAGHTEAAVDIASLAGLSPAGVVCEIMGDDGEMARLPALKQFAATHGLNIATIADLIAYRRLHERMVRRTETTTVKTRAGGVFTLHLYRSTAPFGEHLALVKGDLRNGPVLVRMHALNVLGDVLGCLDEERADEPGDHRIIDQALAMIAREGTGALILLREPRATTLSEQIAGRQEGVKPIGPPQALRDYGVGAQILLDLGIRTMVLISNVQRTIVGLEGYGIEIVGRKPIATGRPTGRPIAVKP
ncbi:MAG: 3,4-dihydroxy-2-butanone-4-phosphate synthase [Pseudomonadota bacterium]